MKALVAFVLLSMAATSAAAAQTDRSSAGEKRHVRSTRWLWASTERPYAGDRPLHATISPNGDGIRDRVAIHVRLQRRSRVDLTIAKTARRPAGVYSRSYTLAAGRHSLHWAPPADTPARTYLVFLRINGRVYGAPSGAPRLRQETPAIRVLGVDAAFGRDSYRRGEVARLRVAADAESLTVQVLRAGPERTPTRGNNEMQGVPVTEPASYRWTDRRHAPASIDVQVGPWPTGVYFAKLVTDDGRIGFAPFIIRPTRLGEHDVAVVLPTNTWQAYNFRDDDGDGWGDTWYAHWAKPAAHIGRPHLDRGVPLAFRRYDLPFLNWLAWNERPVDYLAQRDLERTGSRALRRAYELIIFPGHHEYVTTHEYDVVTGFRDLGGNLMFLSANNFFWRIDRRGDRMIRVAQWRQLGRPEASLIGVQYAANNGARRGSYVAMNVDAMPWLWQGLDVRNGSRIGDFGIEIDKVSPSSPPGTRIVAQIPNLIGPGRSAHMTYYETRAGAKVFATGAFTLAGEAHKRYGETLLNNLWRQLRSEGSTAYRLASTERRGKLEAAFTAESYRPGERATLRLWGKPARVTLQIFRTGPERVRTRGNDEMRGIGVAPAIDRRGARRLAIAIGDWDSGVYFARVRSDRQVAYAPFVVRPRRLGEHRVAVVMPTLTWQAYNFRDDDGDGASDTWYADRRRRSLRLARPHRNHGVPMRFRSYDLPFLHWLAWSKREVDYLAQEDVEAATGRQLRAAYDLLVFPGHHEYVTKREFDAVTRYRDLGGNLMFLSANNFFWRVERRGTTLALIAMWRDLGRPEAALVGVQYVTYGSELRGPYHVRGAHAAPWLFRGTGLRNGSRFGSFGIEIDRITAASPRGTRVIAEIVNGLGREKSGQMTYYETTRGAKVFAAGAFTLAGSATRFYGAQLLENLWRHLSRRPLLRPPAGPG